MRSINPVIRILIASDFFILSSAGFFYPVLALFAANQISGGDASVAGFAWAIYYIMWLVQIPIGKYLDRKKGDRNDFFFLIIGSFMASIVPFLYIFVRSPWQIYLLQALMGLGRGISIPPWFVLFTRRIDKTHEGYEWGVENVIVGLSLATAGAAAGILMKWYGIQVVFVFAGVFSLIGSVLLILIRKYIRQGGKTAYD